MLGQGLEALYSQKVPDMHLLHCRHRVTLFVNELKLWRYEHCTGRRPEGRSILGIWSMTYGQWIEGRSVLGIWSMTYGQ
jgi:hypothetical protein